MEVTRIRPSGIVDSATRFKYSQAVRAGNLLFASGQPGWNENLEIPAAFEDECRAAFENVRAVLAAAGCSFADVVDVVSLHTTGTDFATFWKMREDYFAAPYPAWTVINGIELALPAMHVEIKVTAVVPG
jgi:enamine deaminase RidA (YjgF/YER057c/UK114 family)